VFTVNDRLGDDVDVEDELECEDEQPTRRRPVDMATIPTNDANSDLVCI
jgi:hypothetical protein